MSCQVPNCNGCTCNFMSMSNCEHCADSHAFIYKKGQTIYYLPNPGIEAQVMEVDYKRRVYVLQHVGSFSQFEVSFSGAWRDYTDLPPLSGYKHSSPSYTCDHNWVDVGFHFTKIVCSKCNKEKE